jgi:hypothetical protein
MSLDLSPRGWDESGDVLVAIDTHITQTVVVAPVAKKIVMAVNHHLSTVVGFSVSFVRF